MLGGRPVFRSTDASKAVKPALGVNKQQLTRTLPHLPQNEDDRGEEQRKQEGFTS